VDPGETETVDVTMRLPPPPPPPIPPEVVQAQRDEAAQERWNDGGWNPIPRAMPWGWADTVPSGLVLSAAVGVGDTTRADAFIVDSSGSEWNMVKYGLTIPAFAGYRFPGAPNFAVGGFFAYQMHQKTATSLLGETGEASDLRIGAEGRIFVPLGLLEPYVGAGFGYMRSAFTHATGTLPQDWEKSILNGLAVPVSVGLDVVPFSWMAAGFSFTWTFGVWLEECHSSGRIGYSEGCYDPTKDRVTPQGAPRGSEALPDAWTVDFHLTFYPLASL